MGIFDFLRRNKKKTIPSNNESVANEYIKKVDGRGETKGNQIEIDLQSAEELQKRFFAFDVETTGLSPLTDRIVDLGVVEFVEGVPSRYFSSLVNPGVAISSAATAVNHITNEMISGAPSENEIYPSLIDFLGDALQGKTLLCAHNARFDMDFLCNTLSRLGYDAEIRFVDTLAECRKQINGLKNYKQGTVANCFGIVCREAHRAQSDAETCGQIMIHLLKGKKEELEQQQKRLENLIPSEEELEVCAVIQDAIEHRIGKASYLRFKKVGSYVDINCFYTLCKFKFAKKGKYIITLKSVAEASGLPIEPCTASEGGAGLLRVYFNNPFALEPLFDYFCDRYQKKYTEMQEYISYSKSCRQQVRESLLEGKHIESTELLGLLESARGRLYEELDVQIEKQITKDDVVICAKNDRCPLSAIRNFGDWDAGYREGSPFYFDGEEKRKAGQYEEAIRLFDQARYYGYEAPALYESYAKLYRQIKDYENEVAIIEEFLSRNTYGRENEYRTRLDSALKLLFTKQEAERKAVQKALEKEKRQKEKAVKAEQALLQKKPLGRSIIQLDDEGAVIKEYESISAAVTDTGINSKSIRDAANGVQKHAGGFCWRYKNEE